MDSKNISKNFSAFGRDKNSALSENTSSDQRYLPRWEVNNRLLFKHSDQNDQHLGLTYDLSSMGARIRTSQDLLKDEEIKLIIYLSEVNSVELYAQVVWAKRRGEEIEAGLHFTQLDAQVQDLLLQHAFEIDSKRMHRHWFKGFEGKASSQ